MKIKDNQNCLCVISEKQDISLLIKECNESVPSKKLLFLNRCNLINQYDFIDAMIVPEGVEEVLFKTERKNSFIKTLYIPSTVKRIQIFYEGIVYKKGNGLKIEVSPENPYFISKNGSVYTKDFKELVYFAFEDIYKIDLDSRCEKIGYYAKVPVQKKSSVLKRIMQIDSSGIYTDKKVLKLPEGIETLGNSFLIFRNRKERPLVKIPSTVINIGEWNKAKFKVSKSNPKYSSDSGCLYSKDFKVLLRGVKDNLIVHKACEKVLLNDLFVKSVKIPSSVNQIEKLEELYANVFFKVSPDNPSYSSYEGSLYSKDFKKLLHLYVNKKSQKVFIHPECIELDKNYVPENFTLVRGERPSTFQFIVPDCFNNEKTLTELKSRIFGGKLYYSLEGIEKPVFKIEEIIRNLGDKKLWCGEYGPINKGTVFTEDLQVVGEYFNPGMGQYVPILCSKENLEIISDEKNEVVDIDGKFQVDCKIKNLILLLNKKGFKTYACCSGHLKQALFFSEETDKDPVVVAEIFERKSTHSKTKGYIAFEEKYPELLKLFPKKKSKFAILMQKIFGKTKNSDEPLIYIQSAKESKARLVLRFVYKPTKEVQDKVISILEEKISKI